MKNRDTNTSEESSADSPQAKPPSQAGKLTDAFLSAEMQRELDESNATLFGF